MGDCLDQVGLWGDTGELIAFTKMGGPQLPMAALFPRQEILDYINVEGGMLSTKKHAHIHSLSATDCGSDSLLLVPFALTSPTMVDCSLE